MAWHILFICIWAFQNGLQNVASKAKIESYEQNGIFLFGEYLVKFMGMLKMV